MSLLGGRIAHEHVAQLVGLRVCRVQTKSRRAFTTGLLISSFSSRRLGRRLAGRAVVLNLLDNLDRHPAQFGKSPAPSP